MKEHIVLNKDEYEIDSIKGAKAYEDSRKKAEALSKDPDKLNEFLDKLEEKLAGIPKLGGVLANIPIMVAMVRDYCTGTYKQFPIGTLIGILACLVYFVSPIDIIPDAIPGVGFIDDGAVIAVTLAFVKTDIELYKKWRETLKA